MRDKQRDLRASSRWFNYGKVPYDHVHGADCLASDVTDAKENDWVEAYLVFTYKPCFLNKLLHKTQREQEWRAVFEFDVGSEGVQARTSLAIGEGEQERRFAVNRCCKMCASFYSCCNRTCKTLPTSHGGMRLYEGGLMRSMLLSKSEQTWSSPGLKPEVDLVM